MNLKEEGLRSLSVDLERSEIVFLMIFEMRGKKHQVLIY